MVLALVACSGNPDAVVDKAAGGEEPTVLTMADQSAGLYHNAALQLFVDRVAELSSGSLQIEVVSEWGDFAPDLQQLVVRDVASGEADLAWVGTGVFDPMGVGDFRALNAPMLIDSYPVQAAVLASEIPDQMLPSLEELGVTGLAILADGLRRPISVHGPLLSPEDYEGITFTSNSDTHAEAIEALGADTRVAIAFDRATGLREGEIQGFEMNLLAYRANEFQYLAPYAMANVSLWASPIALIANPEVMDGLTPSQREWIMSAAGDAARQSSTLVDVDESEMGILCETGARFAVASDADLDALRRTFQPVYASLAEDPVTSEFITRIEQLKAATDPSPALEIPADCTGESPIVVAVSDGDEPSQAGTLDLSGTYRWTLTQDDARSLGTHSAEEIATYPQVLTAVLTDRVWSLDVVDSVGERWSADGTYVAEEDLVTFDWPAERLHLEFSLKETEDGSLEFDPVGPMVPGDEFVWSSQTWQRLDDGVVAGRKGSTDLSGTYRWELTEEEVFDFIEVNGPATELTYQIDSFPWVLTMDLTDHEWSVNVLDGQGTNAPAGDGTYTTEGDAITFDWPSAGYQLEFTFVRLDDGTLDLEPAPGLGPADRFVWAFEIWQRVD
jgi:TRAP-type C4-dicarboxylate transport system substrate-binding protein